MKQFRKLPVFLMLLMLGFAASAAKMSDEEKALRKEYSQLIKSIKKANSLKDVVPHKESDGYLWFEGIEGDYSHYYFTSDGQKLIDKSYKVFIYVPGAKAGTSKVDVTHLAMVNGQYCVVPTGEMFEYKTPGYNPVIIAEDFKTTRIFSPAGKLIYETQFDMSYYPGFIVTNGDGQLNSVNKGSASKDFGECHISTGIGTVGVVLFDGKEVLKGVDYLNIKNIDVTPYVTYRKKIDGVDRHGVKKIFDSNFDIPCIFYQVKNENGVWQTKSNRGDDWQAFNPAAVNKITYRDRGEQLYNQGKMADVIKYYEKEGINAPWAKFYTGVALKDRAYNLGDVPLYSFVDDMKKGNFTFRDREKKGPYPDKGEMGVDETKATYALSTKMLKAFIDESQDADMIKKAKKTIEDNDISLGLFSKNAAELPASMQIYYNHQSQLKGEQQRMIAEQQARQQQQAQMWANMIGAFSNMLQSALSPSGGPSKSYSAGGAGSYKSSSAGSSSSSGVDNSGRKGFLKGQIIDWKNKLKKAEKSLEDAIAGGEDTWQKKQVVESKRKTVNECLEMIRQYESELNSLK